MDRSALLALYDQEQRIAIEYPEARKEVLPNLVRFVRPAPGMNFVEYSRLDAAEVDTVIREQVAYFAPMDQPFEWSVCDHDIPPDLKQRLAAHGFAPDDPDDPDMVMVLDLREAPAELLAPVAVDIRPITMRDQLDIVISLEERIWGGDFGWMRQRIGDHLAIPGYLSMYVAYVDETPACVGWTYFHPNSQFAGLWGGSTLPEYRKRGLYTAVLATRVQEAVRRGYRFLTINAGKMSRPIVERHGFQLLTYAYSYKWQGGSS
jgi:hypothetical protein